MRSAVVIEAGRIEVRERDEPVPAPDEVLIEPLLVGLCGSDLAYYRRGANGSFVIREPLVLGHEIVARIAAVGAEATGGWRPGDRVAVHPLWPVPLAGGSTVPPDLADEPTHFLGSASTWPHTHGALTERMAVRPERLRRVPDALPTERAALAEPLSVVLHALDRASDAIPGARVLVCGAGPIGLLAVVALRRRGAASITVVDLHDRPLELATALGADAVVRVADLPGAVASRSFDVALEASGAPSSLAVAIDALAPGGTLVQLGMPPRGGVTVDLAAVVVQELRLLGTHRFLGELDDAVAMLAAAPECDAIVTHVVPLDRVADALALAGDSAVSSKVLVAVAATP